MCVYPFSQGLWVLCLAILPSDQIYVMTSLTKIFSGSPMLWVDNFLNSSAGFGGPTAYAH